MGNYSNSHYHGLSKQKTKRLIMEIVDVNTNEQEEKENTAPETKEIETPVVEIEDVATDEEEEPVKTSDLVAVELIRQMAERRAKEEDKPCGYCVARIWLDLGLTASIILFFIALSIYAVKAEKS
jgi:hypothetical protein